MKILQTLLLCSCALIFASCLNLGTKYSPDKEHEVYYKGDGVTEAHAKKLMDFLKGQGYFKDGHKATVQVLKEKDTFNVKFVYDKKMLNDDVEAAFHKVGGQISSEVFDGGPVSIKLCDENMEQFKDVGYTPPVK